MNFDFLKTKHYYFYYYEANAGNGNFKGYNLVKVTDYFWIKTDHSKIMNFIEKELKKNTKEFAILNFYKVR